MKFFLFTLLLLVGCSSKYQDLHQSLDETLAIVDELYPEEPNIQKMRISMLHGLIHVVDQCASYLNDSQIKFLIESADGSKPRLGINVAKHKDGFEIKKVFEKSAANVAGLKVGDVICEFDGQPLKELTLERFPLLIKERKPYKLLIIRGSHKLIKEIIPDNYPSIEFKWLNNVAYLKLDFISNDCVNHVKNYLIKINDNPKSAALILDLRDSPGGSFNAAIDISAQFLDGHSIVEMQKKYSFSKFAASGKDVLNKLPIFVLQNSNTFSAAEIISAALKGNKRAKIIGQNSGGSATAKHVVNYPNRTDGLIIPIALLNDPNGKRIGKNGVEPDILIEEIKVQKSKQRDLYIFEALRFVPNE